MQGGCDFFGNKIVDVLRKVITFAHKMTIDECLSKK